MHVTLKQIADRAGVHRSTVDKVLHGREGVSDSVRLRIQQIIDELGYQPNVIGKALAQQKRPTVLAVLLLQVDALEEIRAGVEWALEEIRPYGVRVEYHISNDHDSDAQVRILDHLQEASVDGILIMPVRDEAVICRIDRLFEQDIPVVTVNTDLPGSRRACFVGQDSVRAGRVAGALMTEILGGQGTIALITSSASMLCSVDRQQGFEAYLLENSPGLQIEATVETFEEAITAYQETLSLIQSRPNLRGLFVTCGNASEVCRAVRDAGLAGQLKIICFDLYPVLLPLVRDKTITFTIGQSLVAQGQQGLKHLFGLIFQQKVPDTDFIGMPIDIRLSENIDHP
jgi:LacI family transcriptional regulator